MGNNLKHLKIFAFTHRKLDVVKIGLLHIEPVDQAARLKRVKEGFNLDEIMFLSTCNRVEFTIVSKSNISIEGFIRTLYPDLSEVDVSYLSLNVEEYIGDSAVEHSLSVASSIESMIVGEREIITQVRNAFELSNVSGLTGDFLRLLIRQVIETAKKVYTQTSIATKPVSVVSLALILIL